MIADKEGKKQQFLIDLSLSTHVNGFEFGGKLPGSSSSNGSWERSSTLCQPRIHDTPTGTAHYEPFYFTQPQQFASLHFPDDWNKSSCLPLSRTQWEIAPRLSHEFFQFLRTVAST